MVTYVADERIGRYKIVQRQGQTVYGTLLRDANGARNTLVAECVTAGACCTWIDEGGPSNELER